MKNFYQFICILILVLSCKNSTAKTKIEKNKTHTQLKNVSKKNNNLKSMPSAATIKMKNIDEKFISIADQKGKKGTIVIFTCNHCPYSKAWEKRIATIGNEYLAKGFGVIAINPNDPNIKSEDSFVLMQERAKNLKLSFPYTVDLGSKVAKAFNAKKTPEIYIYNSEKNLVYHGAVDDSTEESEVENKYLRNALESLLNNQPIKHAETKAIGCSIKFYN